MAAPDRNEEAIFDVARGIEQPELRRRYVQQACADDRALQARVEGLLRMLDEERSFLESPAAGVRAPVADLAREGPGTVIGPYRLLEPLGEGGFGVVFLAEQTEPVRRKVALKVLKPGMDTRQVVARFEAERQALALMDHPNIAKVHDGGTTPAGRPYFVMELVQGVPVTEFCDRNRLTPRQRLALFLPVCHAVQHAHQKGIIHRDLKPSNILVVLHDATPVPQVIDFGIAKALGQELTDKTLCTGFAQMVGTPLYMSPEQAGMSGLDIDTRSDIYSLGVLLYELLTGTTPFTKERFQEAGYDEIRRIIREEDPARPSTRLSDSKDTLASISEQRGTEPAKLAKLVRGELDWIVMKALDKDRNRRYETANALALDVQRYLADEPVQACPPSAWYRFRKFARRNKGRLTASAGVFLAVTVMTVSIGWAVRDRAARAAESERAEVVRRATVEGQVRESLTTVRTLLAENKLGSAREKLAQARTQLGSDASVLDSLAAEIAAAAADLNRLHRFLDLIERAHQAEMVPLLKAASLDVSLGSLGTQTSVGMGDRWPTAAAPLLLEALQQYGVLEQNDWDSNLEGGFLGKHQVEHIRRIAYEELLWLADDVVRRQQGHRSEGKLSPEAAARQALVYLGKAERARQPTTALHALRALCRKALGEEAAAQADTQLAAKTPPTMAVDHYLRGQGAFAAEQLAAGVQAFEGALRLEPTHYRSMMKLGYCLCDLGRGPEDFVGAVRVFTGCILKRPDHAHAYYCRANAYFLLRRYQEAVADYSTAIELDPEHELAWFSRGATHNNLNEFDKAVADYSRAIELAPKFARAWNNRGVTYHRQGRQQKAVADYSRAIQLDPKFAVALNNRGFGFFQLGKVNDAIADYSRAIRLDPKLVLAWTNRGSAYLKLGKAEDAVAEFCQAIKLDPNSARAWNERGNAYFQMGKPEKTLTDCTRAIELDPMEASAWLNRGAAYTKLGKPNEALTDFSKVIDLGSKNPFGWLNRGIVYVGLDQPDKAVANLSRAIELAPTHPKVVQAYFLRALAHGQLAHFEEARTDYQAFLKHAPNHARTHDALAWILATCPDAKLRDPKRAVELARKAVQLEPKVGIYWRTLGVAHYRAGEWKAAVAALDKSLTLRKSGDAVDQFFLAMAHRKLGNRDAARKGYERAVQWLETYKEPLERARVLAEQLRHFRAEAEEVLELTKK